MPDLLKTDPVYFHLAPTDTNLPVTAGLAPIAVLEYGVGAVEAFHCVEPVV